MPNHIDGRVLVYPSFSGKSIINERLDDEPVVIIEPQSSRPVRSVVPVSRLTEVIDYLERADTDGKPLYYSSSRREVVTCTVCGECIPSSTQQKTLRLEATAKRGVRFRGDETGVFFHEACRGGLVEELERVWERDVLIEELV